MPIGGYDKAGAEVVLVRLGEIGAVAYYGADSSLWSDPATEAEDSIWRFAAEFNYGTPLPFTPAEYAQIDGEWRERLMAA